MKPLFLSIAFFIINSFTLSANDANVTQPSRIEIVITVAGMQESVDAITKSSKQLIVLTKQLSNKKEFSNEDQKVITALAQALNNNAEAINNIAAALPQQFDKVQGSTANIVDTAKLAVQEVIKSSKSDFVDPTLSSIENRLLVFVFIVAALIFGLLGFVFWKVRVITETGSETVQNVMTTIKSLEKVLEKIQVEK